jgi:hypothetical protein
MRNLGLLQIFCIVGMSSAPIRAACSTELLIGDFACSGATQISRIATIAARPSPKLRTCVELRFPQNLESALFPFIVPLTQQEVSLYRSGDEW